MEPCFIWQEACSKGDQYAAWVQAFGSVAAIFYAGWLARSTEQMKIANNSKLIITVLGNLRSEIDSSIQHCAIGDQNSLHKQVANYKVLIEQASFVDPRLLPFSAAIALHTIISAAESAMADCAAPSAGAQFSRYHGAFQYQKQRIDGASTTIHEAIRHSKWWKKSHM